MRNTMGLALGATICLATLPNCGIAQAASITFTAIVPEQVTDFTANTMLSQFDPALGKLTAVSLSIATNGNISGSVQNTSAVAQNFTVTETVVLALTSTNSDIMGLANFSNLTRTLTDMGSHTGLPAGAMAPFGPFTPTSSATISASSLTPFIGTGTIPFTLTTMTSTVVSGGGGTITDSITATAAATETVVYTYTAPEPASLILGVTSIAGCGSILVLRRKAAR